MKKKKSYFSNNYNPAPSEESTYNSNNFYQEEDLMTPQPKARKESKPTPLSFLKGNGGDPGITNT